MPAGAEPGEDLLASESTEEEHAKGIGIEGVGDEETDSSRMFAGVGPVWTGAARLQFARPGEQVETDGTDVVADARWKLTIEQGRGVADLGSQRIEHPVPFLLAERPHADAHLVGRPARSLDVRGNLAGRQGQSPHCARAGIAAAAR
jgi:hypothetical protein